MQELCLLCGAHKTSTTPYHPANDGLVERFNRTLLMMLAMFMGEKHDDWDDLLLAVMMAYRSSVHESTGFTLYHLMFGEECTLPMDVGLPRRDQDLPDPIKNLYALWVRDALEVAYDQVRRHSGQAVRRQKWLYNNRAVQRLFAVVDCAITRQLKSASWTRPGLVHILWCRSLDGIRRFSWCIVKISNRFRARGVWCPD